MIAPVRPWTVLVITGAAVVGVDQLSKIAALRGLDDPIPLLPGLTLELSFNTGAAFSMGTALTPLFTLIAVVVVGWIVVRAPRIATRSWAVAVGLIGGGAAGNLVDRIFRPPGVARGAVVDFIDVSWFASFNIADAALTGGVALAIVLAWREVPLFRGPVARETEQ